MKELTLKILNLIFFSNKGDFYYDVPDGVVKIE